MFKVSQTKSCFVETQLKSRFIRYLPLFLDHPATLKFLSCMAFSVYEVIRVACLSRGWFVYST